MARGERCAELLACWATVIVLFACMAVSAIATMIAQHTAWQFPYDGLWGAGIVLLLSFSIVLLPVKK